MIGCLIVGGLTMFAISRAICHHRGFCGPRGFHRHHRAWHGAGGWHDRWHGGGPGWGSDPWGLGDEPESGRAPWTDDMPSGGSGWGKRFFIRRVAEHVRATPEQERRLADAVAVFREEIKKTGGGEGRKTRQELADALRSQTFDGVVLGEQFARHDTVLEGARKAFVGLVARIHDTLEPEQRVRLAEMLERGPRFGRSFMSW